MNVWTRIELAVKSTSRHSPLPWVGTHTRARSTLDTNTLTASSLARTTNVVRTVRAPSHAELHDSYVLGVCVVAGGSANMQRAFNAARRNDA